MNSYRSSQRGQPTASPSHGLFWWTPLALGLGLLAKVSTSALWPVVGLAIVLGAARPHAQHAVGLASWLRTLFASWRRWLLTGLIVFVPALLIAAVALPGMDVSQLIRELRCADIDLPVIAIGADADVPAVVELMRAGAADFIAFPFTARKLRTAMRSLGDRVRAGSKRAKDEGLS